ncbi:hypothetical protein K7432_014699 [Basidiobolus ranarum]|uniref:Uncharacterized protein n=1 Tax=Basidiobolus ranarum TaxID=34480 RepID=A0ABR2WH70_9FUNG
MRQALFTILGFVACALGAPVSPAGQQGNTFQITTDANAASIYCYIYKLNCGSNCGNIKNAPIGSLTCAPQANSTTINLKCQCGDGTDYTQLSTKQIPTAKTTKATVTSLVIQDGNVKAYCDQHKPRCGGLCQTASPKYHQWSQDCYPSKDEFGRLTASAWCICNQCDISPSVR